MNLEKYKWKSRILFVSTPNYKEKKYLNLKKIYQDRIKEFHKRHIKLICKTNKKSNFSINLIGCNIMDGLYWRFINRNRSFFLKNPRLSMMVRILDKMKQDRKKLIFSAADKFIKENTNVS